MPQISQIDSFLSQIFWLFLAFGILYFFILRVATPRISGVLLRRETAIASDLESAEKARDGAYKASEELDKKLSSARASAQKIVFEAEESVKKTSAEQLKNSEAKFKENISKAEIEISTAKNNSLDSLNSESVDFIEQILSKLAGLSVSRDIIEKTLSKTSQN